MEKVLNNEEFTFRVLLRKPKYPVIVIAKDDIRPAYRLKELATVCYLSEPRENSNIIKMIDSSGEEFWCSKENGGMTPGFFSKKWTKNKIVDLFNESATAKENDMQYSTKSLSNKRLATIVTEICDILRDKNEM